MFFTTFLMICRSPFAIYLGYLSTKGELLHLNGRLFGFVKNKSKSRFLKNLLKLKNLLDIGGVSLEVTIGIGILTDNEGRDLIMCGSRKARAIFINSTSFFQKIYCTHFEVVSYLT